MVDWSFKLLHPHENIGEKRRWLNQICRNSGRQSKVFSNQAEVQSRKAIFKTGGQFCSIFPAITLPFLQCSNNLSLSSSNSSQSFSSNWREKTRTYLQTIVYVLFWSEGVTRRSLSCINMNTGRESGKHCSCKLQEDYKPTDRCRGQDISGGDIKKTIWSLQKQLGY